jgi:hypothetical protein
MKTAVLGRNGQHEPIWNPAYQKLAVEFTFHPEACAPASGNQKGAVENLVKFVKSNFIMGRSFHDDADLAQQWREWLSHVNTQRNSDATGQLPVAVLAQEQPHFGTLPDVAQDYGFYDWVIVSREGLVAIETNRYSVPAHLIGQPLTARIHSSHIEVFYTDELVTSHPRSKEQHARILTPAHFEEAFKSKPRGRVMVYRDWLCDLSPQVNSYIHTICHKRRREMRPQMIALYERAQEMGTADFVAALELAAEQQMYGAEYIRAIVALPASMGPISAAETDITMHLPDLPAQQEIERDLGHYERYVTNRAQVEDLRLTAAGGQL